MTGEEVRTLRTEIGISRGKLAQYLGVHPFTIRRWELGLTHIQSEAYIYLLRILEESFREDPDGIRSQFSKGSLLNIRFTGRSCVNTCNPELQPETHTAS